MAVMWFILTAGAQDKPPTAPAPALPQTEMQKWIADTDALWQAACKRDVTDPYAAELEKLKTQYLSWITAGLTKAAEAGDLDDSIAWRNEQKRFAGTSEIPAQDDPADLPAVKQLRIIWRTQIARMEKDRAARMKALHGQYDAALAQAQTQLAQNQRLDDALLIKAKRDEVATAWLAGLPAAAPPAVPPIGTAPGKTPLQPTVPFKAGAHPVERADLYASANNHHVVFVNGKEVMKNVTRDKPEKQRVNLKEGSVITVRMPDRFSDNFFWLSAISTDGEFLFETSEQWMAYIPADEKKWWEIKNPKEQKQAVLITQNRQYIDLIRRSADATPHYRGTPPIHSPLQAGPRLAFLYYIVTRQDLIPKEAEKGK